MADNWVKTAKVKFAQFRNLGILAVIVVICLMVFIYLGSNRSLTQVSIKTEKENFASPIKHLDAESVILEKTQKALNEIKQKTENIQQKLDNFVNGTTSEFKLIKDNHEEAMKRVSTLEKKLKEEQDPGSIAHEQGTSPIQENNEYPGNIFTGASSQEAIRNYKRMPSPGIREDSLTLAKNVADTANSKPMKNPDTYVPAGTFVKAVMIGGADASAAVNAQANPVPMLFRLIANGTLPNHQKSHLKDCFITAAVVGDISSERGQIRTESLSCVYPNGIVVDQQVEGTVFGPDGKNAVRGNYYMGGGRFVGNAFAAGALSGVSDGLSQTYTTNSISAEGNVQTINPGNIFAYGAAKGTGKAMDKLADYNIKRAEQYHPVIQLGAGTEVDIVFLKGFYLDGKKHESHDSSVETYSDKTNSTPTLFPPPSSESATLPLSDESVRRIQENSKELGLRVTTAQE